MLQGVCVSHQGDILNDFVSNIFWEKFGTEFELEGDFFFDILWKNLQKRNVIEQKINRSQWDLDLLIWISLTNNAVYGNNHIIVANQWEKNTILSVETCYKLE